jgi:DNA repair protein RadC
MQTATAKKYYVPVFRCQLVRESSQKSDTRQIGNPSDAAVIARKYLEGADREHFCVMFLNVKNRVLGINTVSIGGLNESPVHPREVFKPAILLGAAAIILFHNHPSGDPSPSKADMEATRQLCEAGKIIGIEVLDHIVIGEEGFTSFKERGLI